MWWFLLLACPAEQLGVTLPAGGVEAMSNEDLQRDVWSLSRAELKDRRVGTPGHRLGVERIASRFQQMHTLPAIGEAGMQVAGDGFNLCMVQKGKSQEHVLLSTTDHGHGAYQSASGVAGLIALAKTFDGAERPPHSVLFCVFAGEEGQAVFESEPVVPWDTVRTRIAVGPLGSPGELVVSKEEHGGLFIRSPEPSEAKSPGLEEDLDFRMVLTQLREIHAVINEEMLRP